MSAQRTGVRQSLRQVLNRKSSKLFCSTPTFGMNMGSGRLVTTGMAVSFSLEVPRPCLCSLCFDPLCVVLPAASRALSQFMVIPHTRYGVLAFSVAGVFRAPAHDPRACVIQKARFGHILTSSMLECHQYRRKHFGGGPESVRGGSIGTMSLSSSASTRSEACRAGSCILQLHEAKHAVHACEPSQYVWRSGHRLLVLVALPVVSSECPAGLWVVFL